MVGAAGMSPLPLDLHGKTFADEDEAADARADPEALRGHRRPPAEPDRSDRGTGDRRRRSERPAQARLRGPVHRRGVRDRLQLDRDEQGQDRDGRQRGDREEGDLRRRSRQAARRQHFAKPEIDWTDEAELAEVHELVDAIPARASKSGPGVPDVRRELPRCRPPRRRRPAARRPRAADVAQPAAAEEPSSSPRPCRRCSRRSVTTCALRSRTRRSGSHSPGRSAGFVVLVDPPRAQGAPTVVDVDARPGERERHGRADRHARRAGVPPERSRRRAGRGRATRRRASRAGRRTSRSRRLRSAGCRQSNAGIAV